MSKKILVVGELNADMIFSDMEVFPSLGQEIVAGSLHTVLGSSSAICAAGLARLGARVDFLGKVGVDYYGEFVTRELKDRGVGIQHIVHDQVVRTGLTLSLTYPQDRALVTYLGCIAQFCLADIKMEVLRGYDHVHVGAYFLQRGLQPGLVELFTQAHRLGLTTSLDTGWDPDESWGGAALLAVLDHVDLFFPNEGEACAISEADTVEAALQVLGRRVKLVVAKLGAKGAVAVHEGQGISCPGFTVDTVDTTGAGDSFDAGFLFAHVVQEQPLAEALRFANGCGALSTTGYGGTGAQPTLRQVQELLEEH